MFQIWEWHSVHDWREARMVLEGDVACPGTSCSCHHHHYKYYQPGNEACDILCMEPCRGESCKLCSLVSSPLTLPKHWGTSTSYYVIMTYLSWRAFIYRVSQNNINPPPPTHTQFSRPPLPPLLHVVVNEWFNAFIFHDLFRLKLKPCRTLPGDTLSLPSLLVLHVFSYPSFSYCVPLVFSSTNLRDVPRILHAMNNLG